MEVDPSAKRLRLHDPANWQVPTGAVTAPVRFERGHAFIDTNLTLPSGERLAMPMHLDTGMSAALALVVGNPPALTMPERGEVISSCYVGSVREDRLGPPVTVEIGGARFADVTPRYSQPGERPSLQERGAVGSGVLSTRRYAIDYPGKRLVFL